MAGGLFDALHNDEGDSDDDDDRVFLVADDSPCPLEQLPNMDVSDRRSGVVSGVGQFSVPYTSTDVGHVPIATPGSGGAPSWAPGTTPLAVPFHPGGGARSPASMHAPGAL